MQVKGSAQVTRVRARLTEERAKLETLSEKAGRARAKSSGATPGGLDGYDPAILSGTRRRPNHRAEKHRHAAYDREAAAFQELEQQGQIVAGLERALKRAEDDAKASCDVTSLAPGSFVRDRYGWHRVVRVSKKSVSVETGFSWTDRISLEKVIETRGTHA